MPAKKKQVADPVSETPAVDVPTLEWDFAENLYKNRAGDGHIKGCLYGLQSRYRPLAPTANIRLYDAYDSEGGEYIVEAEKARVHNANTVLATKANLRKCKVGEQLSDLLIYEEGKVCCSDVGALWTDWITETPRSVTFQVNGGGVFVGTMKKNRYMDGARTFQPKRIS